MKQSSQIQKTQSIIASAKMQQSIKILQMSSDELTEYIATQAINNPFLEMNEQPPIAIKEDKAEEGKNDDNYWQNDNYTKYEKGGSNPYSCDNIPANNIGLREFLANQISLCHLKDSDKILAMQLLDNIDENGYLHLDLQELADLNHTSKEHIELILDSLQTMEPSGIFARSLAECLQIQLIDLGKLSVNMQVLLDNLDLLAAKDHKKLLKILKVSPEELEFLIKQIKELDPKPGRNFGNDLARTIIPDANIIRSADCKLNVLLNDFSSRIRVNKEFFESAVISAKQKEEIAFCNKNYQSANWLYKAVKLRGEMLLKILNVIGSIQFEFFTKGIHYLKPMTLADIANKVGVHESTVSRICNKYVATPFGVMQIKSFFTNALSTNYSEDKISTAAIKQRIKEIIEKEDQCLCDDQIAKILVQEGIVISRRTVHKYREAMKILSSHERRRKKGL